MFQRGSVRTDDMQCCAERCHLVDAWPAFERSRYGVETWTFDDEGGEPRILHHLRHGAGGQQFAVGDVGDAVAALGFVHVVGRNQHGQPAAREVMDLVPEFASGLGIDAGGRLVQQQQARLVHDAGGQRQPLFPAAGQRAGELVAPAGKAKLFQRPCDMILDRFQAVQAGNEFEVFTDCQVLVERELLRHVANLVLDLQALGPEVIAEHGAFAFVGRQQPAHHADRCRLA